VAEIDPNAKRWPRADILDCDEQHSAIEGEVDDDVRVRV
jgi:hypothetical protein